MNGHETSPSHSHQFTFTSLSSTAAPLDTNEEEKGSGHIAEKEDLY